MKGQNNILFDIDNLKIKIFNDISIENKELINFLNIFSKFDKRTEDIIEFIYSDTEISQNFFNLIKLNESKLIAMLDILEYLKDNLANKDLEICRDEINRGIYEINWIIEEKRLYQSIFNNFDNEYTLTKENIVNKEYRNQDSLQENYLIKTFANKLWRDIDKVTIVNFLEGLDFYYLSNELYFFLLPACIRYGIEYFEDEKDLEFLIFFLSDKDRISFASSEIKELVISYLNLLKKLNFFNIFGKEEKECLELWSATREN